VRSAPPARGRSGHGGRRGGLATMIAVNFCHMTPLIALDHGVAGGGAPGEGVRGPGRRSCRS
jgi:hypothetical protein